MYPGRYPAMGQIIRVNDTVEKIDNAVIRLQEVQSALRHLNAFCEVSDVNVQKTEAPNRVSEDTIGYLREAENHRRWSTPASGTYNALADVVAVSKFAKKTVDMVKVQNRKRLAEKSTYISSTRSSPPAEQTSLLQPSNRINLLTPVNMSSTRDLVQKPRNASKENERPVRRRKPQGDSKLSAAAGGSSSILHEKEQLDSSLPSIRSASRTHSAVIAPGLGTTEHPRQDSGDSASSISQFFSSDLMMRDAPPKRDVKANIFRLKSVKNDDPTTIDFTPKCDDDGETDSTLKPSSSMGTSMRTEVENREMEDIMDSFSSSLASKGFSVQLEEIKRHKKKSWNFSSHGKTSGNVVMMFGNPTFDETTPPSTTPPHDRQKATAFPAGMESNPPSLSYGKKMQSSNKKDGFQKREKIVRLSPCTSSAANPVKGSIQRACDKPKKQKWLNRRTEVTGTPTLIRRLPEAHEMEEIRHTAQILPTCRDDSHLVSDTSDDGHTSGNSLSSGSSLETRRFSLSRSVSDGRNC
ncbi:hypothetical protein KP509_1Z110200 [Ceratopteris richardii]|nr:hypothetical protein KP509_1Z110200 [Ceratopteris richardii]